MFLNILKQNDKTQFLSLLYELAEADGIVREQEIAYINAYAHEMQISADLTEKVALDTAIEYFKNADEKIKKIIFIELIGLAYSDNDFCEIEQNLMKRIQQDFLLTEDFFDKAVNWVEKNKLLYAEGIELVGL